MEDFELDLVIGEGPAARTVRIELQPFTLVGATTRSGLLPAPLREGKAFLAKGSGSVPEGFAHYLAFNSRPEDLEDGTPCTLLGDEFGYLDDGDVIGLGGDGRVRSLYRASSNHNSLLLTEQCNNYCLMCSQPPKRIDDSWLLEEDAQTFARPRGPPF